LPTLFTFLTNGHAASFRIPTHLTWRERLFLYETVKKLNRGSSIVEIGSYLGASSCFLAAAAEEMGCRVHCIDTWQNEGMTEGPRDTFSAFSCNTGAYRESIVPLRMKSEEAISVLEEVPEMLFIDGDHSYEGVSTDLRAWLPKLRNGAWLLLHDSGWAEGVQRAIREMVAPVQVESPTVLPNLYATRVAPRANGPIENAPRTKAIVTDRLGESVRHTE
jgi:predicted O-methyltransferase YrrM